MNLGNVGMAFQVYAWIFWIFELLVQLKSVKFSSFGDHHFLI